MRRKILITGGTGFLGTHLTAHLSRCGHSVFAVGRDSGDLLSLLEADQVVNEIEPEIIIHAAADCGGIGYNQEKKSQLFSANLRMGLNMIDAARTMDTLRLLINVGSTCAYPVDAPVPIHEDSLHRGLPEETNRPYGLAKRMVHYYGDLLRRTENFPFVTAQLANLYGPEDTFDERRSHVIPALIRRIYEAKSSGLPSVTIWGSGNATRDFLYVQDAAGGIDRIISHDPLPEESIFNLGSCREISIRDLTSEICRQLGYSGEIEFDPSKPDGQPRRLLDCSEAQQALGYQPTYSLEAGLAETIEWYIAHRRERDALEEKVL